MDVKILTPLCLDKRSKTYLNAKVVLLKIRMFCGFDIELSLKPRKYILIVDVKHWEEQ